MVKKTSNKMLVETLAFILAITLVLTIVTGCTTTTPEPVTEVFHQSYNYQNGMKLTLTNINGDVSVTTWEQNTVDVYALKRSNYGNTELNKIQIVVATNGVITITTSQTGNALGVSVDYIIKVPRGMQVTQIKTSNGNIEISDTFGDVQLETSNGQISVQSVNGIVKASTSNGDINIENVVGVKGLETSNGDIIAEIPYIQSDVYIKTNNGNIIVKLPTSINITIDAITSYGQIYPNNAPIIASTLTNTYLYGTMGNGGSKLSVQTSNGDINFNIL